MNPLLSSPLYVAKGRPVGPALHVRKSAGPPSHPDQRPPVITVDLDGTLAEDVGSGVPLDEREPREGAAEALTRMRAAGIWVIVWTANEEGEESVADWLAEYGIPYDEINNNRWDDGGTRKIRSDAYLDDKAIPTTDRDWDELASEAIIEVLGKARQPIDKYDGYKELRELAEQAQPELEEFIAERLSDPPVFRIEDAGLGELEAALAKPGPLLVVAPVKTEKRAAEKVESDYGGRWDKLLDMVRVAVAFDTLDELYAAVNKLTKPGG